MGRSQSSRQLGPRRGAAARSRVALVDKAIRTERILSEIGDGAYGGQAVFIGVVRNRNLGRPVRAVSYEAHGPMAEKELGRIASEARRKWGPKLSVALVHRTGRLKVGEASILCAAFSPHRGEAFDACRYLIEEVKHRVPIWKKEHYVAGDSAWVPGCELKPRLSRRKR